MKIQDFYSALCNNVVSACLYDYFMMKATPGLVLLAYNNKNGITLLECLPLWVSLLFATFTAVFLVSGTMIGMQYMLDKHLLNAGIIVQIWNVSQKPMC